MDAVSQATRELVFTLDGKGCFTHVNEAAREFYGYSPKRLIGRAFTEFVAPDFAEQDRQFLQSLKRSRECVHHETVHQHRYGTRLHLAISAIGHGDGATGTARDVTHLRDLEQRLVRTERMHAVGALAGGVAHDFKNLLTVIKGQAEIAQRDPGPNTARRLSTILETAERGRAMVEELLVFARKQNQRHEVLDLVDVVKGMEDLLRRLLRYGTRLKLRLARKPVYVRADRGKLEQILMNLVINAQDASHDGGSIAIRVAYGKLGVQKTQELGIEPGKWAVLQVVDRGEGMDAETQSQVFEPFYTTKEEGKGTGLGLATVQGIVHQYGGAVAIRSVPGRGTRMSVLLPLVQRGDTPPDDETTDSNPTALKHRRDAKA